MHTATFQISYNSVSNLCHFPIKIFYFTQGVKKVRSFLMGKDNSRINDVPHMVGFTHTGKIGVFIKEYRFKIFVWKYFCVLILPLSFRELELSAEQVCVQGSFLRVCHVTIIKSVFVSNVSGILECLQDVH